MGLDSLFADREVRKLVRESVYNAKELEQGFCDICGEDASSLFSVYGKNLCESCCEKLISESYNYENVYTTIEDFKGTFIGEGCTYIMVNVRKLEDEALKKFGGDVPALLKSYDLKVGKVWNYEYDMGIIWIDNQDITSGKTHLNQFMLDFDAGFRTPKVPTITPDADGTSCPIKIIGRSDPMRKDNLAAAANSKWNKKNANASGQTVVNNQTVTVPASTTVVPATPAPAPAVNVNTVKSANKAVKPAPAKVRVKGLNIKGDINKFGILVDNNEVISVVTTLDANGNRVAEVTGTVSVPVTLQVGNESEPKNVAEIILNDILVQPDKYFKSFEEESAEISLNTYDFYKFVLDKESFSDGKFSLATKFKTTLTNTRCYLPYNALVSRSSLIGGLEKQIDDVIKKKYPLLFDGNNVVNTSLGKVEFKLLDIDDQNNIVIQFAIGDAVIKHVEKDKTKLQTKSKDVLYDIILDHMESVINGFKDKTLDKKGDYRFQLEVGDDKTGYYIYADFDENEFLDSGNLIFKFSIIDKLHGIEQPKTQKPVTYKYNRNGNILSNFMKREGEIIYNEFLKTPDLDITATASAQNKLKNQSKKFALFDKARDIFLKNNKKFASAVEDLQTELSFDVNKDGKLMSAKVSISDPDLEVSSGGKSLLDYISKKHNFKNVEIKALGNDPPTVVFNFKDLQSFADSIEFSILESMVFEAFELVRVNEGRKTFYV